MGLRTGCCKIVRTASHRPQVSFFPFFDRISRLDRYRRKRSTEKIADFIYQKLCDLDHYYQKLESEMAEEIPQDESSFPGDEDDDASDFEQNQSLFLLRVGFHARRVCVRLPRQCALHFFSTEHIAVAFLPIPH